MYYLEVNFKCNGPNQNFNTPEDQDLKLKTYMILRRGAWHDGTMIFYLDLIALSQGQITKTARTIN